MNKIRKIKAVGIKQNETITKPKDTWQSDSSPVKFVPMKNVSKHICETVQAIAMLLGFDPDERQCLSSLTTQQIERCGDLVKKGFKEQSFITLNHPFVRHRHVHNKKRIVPEWQNRPFPFLMQRWTCTRSGLLPEVLLRESDHRQQLS